ncbi:MAG: hypothetical protein JW718_07745 [Desulfovibrionaceae bacterium]|nr:hypothetical protein [Desulfovibrionaceae bacterium]
MLRLFETGDVTTVIHETGHILRRQLGERDLAVIEAWAAYHELAEPVAVFDSATMANSFVVPTGAFDAQGRPILAAVHLAVRHGRLEVNEIASVYGRENASAWLRQQIDARRVLYLDKKKAAEVQRSGRLQSPREMHRGGKKK